MFILDSLLIGSLRFVFDKIATVVDTEMQDDSVFREQLLDAQMRFELGDLSEAEFIEIERDLLARIREIKGGHQGALTMTSSGTKVSSVEADVADELRGRQS